MKVENPAAFSYLFQDDIFLLSTEKHLFNGTRQANVEPAPEAAQVIQTPTLHFNYLGKNLKKFVVTVNYPQHEHIQPEHLAALEATLKRKELMPDDVAIVNLAKHAGSGFADLLQYFSPQKLLVMGNDAKPAGLNAPTFNTIQVTDDVQVLPTFSFAEMMTSTDNKKAFWEQVKNF